MTFQLLLAGERVVVSIPVQELAGAAAPGVLFPLDQLNFDHLSVRLRSALKTLIDNNRDTWQTFICVIRPEIFTHGVTEQWLKRQLGTIQKHICFSDGNAFKIIEGLDNYLFVYGLDLKENLTAFLNLCRWAPEMASRFSHQINSAISFKMLGCTADLPTVFLAPADMEASPPQTSFYNFFLHQQSFDRSAENMLQFESALAPDFDQFEKVVYLPFTQTAAHDYSFCAAAADRIIQTYFDPSLCLLIGLPELAATSTFEARVTVVLAGLAHVKEVFPRAPAANVFFVSDDSAASALTDTTHFLQLELHQSFGQWRYAPAFFKRAQQIVYHQDELLCTESTLLKAHLKQLFGCRATLEILRVDPSKARGLS